MGSEPLVTIVTPVRNLAAYVEATVRSVLQQDYPHIEYIVMDGGSTDGTLEVLAKYRAHFHLISQPDQGTTDAVNRGFLLSRGEIFAFLNADDTYLPGAVRAAVECLQAHPEAGGVYGDADWVDEQGRRLGRYPTRDFDADALRQECFICQPACFLRREIFERAGGLDPSLRYAFDYDLWIRVSRFSRLQHLPRLLAQSRMRRDNKTLADRRRVFQENIAVLKRHFGYAPFCWIYSYTAHLLDRRDQFYQPLKPSLFKLLLSLPVGWRYNPRHPVRLLRELASWLTLESAERHWQRLRGRL